MRSMIIMFALILAIAPALAMDVNVTAEDGIVGKPAEFTVRITDINVSKTVPVDVVLVMDCSGSMMRWGNIITDLQYVTLSKRYKKVGEFTLDKTSGVEVMLQKPLDIYDHRDKFRAYIKNKNTGEIFSDTGYSTVRWDNVPAGTYEVYAKVMSRSSDQRIFCVELPPERIVLAKSAAKTFVDLLGENDRVALVKFTSYYNDWQGYTEIVKHLTSNKADIKSAINSLKTLHGTPMGYGLQLAIQELDTNGRKGSNKVIILLTDGWWNMGPDPMDVAGEAAGKGYKIYTIGYGGADEETLKAIAEKTGGKYYFAANRSDLEQIYSQIANVIKVVARDAVLKIELENVTFVDAEPDCKVEGDTLIWEIGDISIANPELTFTVTVISSKTGRIKVGDGWFNYTDINGNHISKEFDVYMNFINNPPNVTVVGNTKIREREWLKLTIFVQDPDGHEVSLDYTAPISGTFKRINSTTWTLSWLPSAQFVESGARTFTIEFVATDEYGATAEKDVEVTVYDLEKWLDIWTDKNVTTVYEGNTTEIKVYVDSSSSYNVTFEVYNAEDGTYVAMLQSAGNNTMIFSFAPQYDLTDNVTNVTVVFKAENEDDLTANTSVTITVKNVNTSVWAKFCVPRAEIYELENKMYYVGEPIRLKVRFINATMGNVTLNGVEVWRSTLTPPIDNRTVIVIPNTAGWHRIVVWAMNENLATPTNYTPIFVSIKPIS